jgi:RHS repeat-associated protein
LVYHAWNRLVQYKSGNGVLTAYTYDALGRRVTENPGTLRSLYYSFAWQDMEEDVSGNMQDQYVWSPVYVDALIARDTPNQRLYAQQDFTWNLTAITDASGNVQERYVYDPFGQCSVLAPNWAARGSSSFSWVYVYQGGRYDGNTGLLDFRRREYSPVLGRWIQVDPIVYRAGDPNVYRFEADRPIGSTDPTGLEIAGPGYNPYASPFQPTQQLGSVGDIFGAQITLEKPGTWATCQPDVIKKVLRDACWRIAEAWYVLEYEWDKVRSGWWKPTKDGPVWVPSATYTAIQNNLQPYRDRLWEAVKRCVDRKSTIAITCNCHNVAGDSNPAYTPFSLFGNPGDIHLRPAFWTYPDQVGAKVWTLLLQNPESGHGDKGRSRGHL